MKLLSLNLYGGNQGKLLFDYLKEQSAHTDIFCFQEVFNSPENFEISRGARIHLFEELKILLSDFEAVFHPYTKGMDLVSTVDFELELGQASFVRKGLQIKSSGDFYIFGGRDVVVLPDITNEPKTAQWLKLVAGDKEFLVLNVHGLWYPAEKKDHPNRTRQSQLILDFLKTYSGPKIVCGDFNLDITTECLKMLENAGLKNLIKEYGITTTRNKISLSKYPDDPHYFADYTFISQGIKVNSFEVPYNEASDHLPMRLDFTI